MADAAKKRVTAHRGRKGKNGVYSPKHNDRQFDTSEAEHIDGSLSVRNQYRKYNEVRDTASFEEHEKAFYEATFGEALASYNDKQIRSKHPSRVKTMDEYRRSERTCPEEIILQVGDRKNTVSAGQLHMINTDFIEWHTQAFPQFKLLDYADHFDEPDCAPHGQLRGVWVAYDDKGNAYVSQKDALAQMGIQPPKPDKKIDRYNNPKMTYTAMCRAKMIDIARSHGIEIEDVPREASKSGLDLATFKLRRTQEEYSRLRAENERLTADNSRLQAENGSLQARNGDLSQQVIKLQAEKEKAVQERTAALQELREKQEKDEKDFQAREDKLEAQQRAIDEERKQLDERREQLYTPPVADEKIPPFKAKEVVRQKNEQIAVLQQRSDRRDILDGDLQAASKARSDAERQSAEAAADRQTAATELESINKTKQNISKIIQKKVKEGVEAADKREGDKGFMYNQMQAFINASDKRKHNFDVWITRAKQERDERMAQDVARMTSDIDFSVSDWDFGK